MFLTSVVIKNFRALEEIHVDFSSKVSVVVGPNAIGKTTLLEAIRFVKALLAPRTQGESNQVLFALGASTPYNPQQLIAGAIAGDPQKPVQVRCVFKLSGEEVSLLEQSIDALANQLFLSRIGREFANVSDTIASLSGSQGQDALQTFRTELSDALANIRLGKLECSLAITLDPVAGSINSGDPIGATIFAFLDRRLPPSMAIFSYFPADRAIPMQDPPIQIGIADAVNQIESHNSQPQLKYQRLKNTIFNAVIASESGRAELDSEFARIFDRILKGRRLVGVGVNQQGLLNVGVQDVETGKVFNLDAMSSGEKGLILTFLLVARTIVGGGIVILDEPELHLNPAVCKDLLSFLVEEYATPRDLQLIICSHSPEILSSAFERDDCTLYHLRSGRLLTPVRRQDQGEVNDALRRLGSSESEALLYQATVFVEGEHDSEILEAGFEKLFRRYRFKDLGGRSPVEKEIKSLQAAERRGISVSPQYFIFDRDGAPTDLTNSQNIRLLQWRRRCLENYLIDIDVLTDVLKDSENVTKTVQSIGEMQNILKDLATDQLSDIVARDVYTEYNFENPGMRASEIQGKSTPEIASLLFARLKVIKGQVDPLDEPSWCAEFVLRCQRRRASMEEKWDAKWRDDCDGKRLFRDLQRTMKIRMPLIKFKKRVVVEMRNTSSEGWRTMESLLKELIQSP